ncbi:MAG: hypothetical protein ACYDDS_10690 [Candidatus Sulfotelmatobacter sp.]
MLSSSETDLEQADTGIFDRFSLVDVFAFYWSVETNLPAMPVVVPSYWLLNEHIHPFKTPWRIFGFGVAGVGIWFFVGRSVDDVLAAIRISSSGAGR